MLSRHTSMENSRTWPRLNSYLLSGNGKILLKMFWKSDAFLVWFSMTLS